jgi:large subunit ribosomal protein L21
MFAIFTTGGKQYKVSVNDVFYTDNILAKVGEQVTFDQILMVDDQIGTPYLPNAKVVCEVQKQGKQAKLLIIKHISQKHHTKRQGHRQDYTRLIVRDIKITKG